MKNQRYFALLLSVLMLTGLLAACQGGQNVPFASQSDAAASPAAQGTESAGSTDSAGAATTVTWWTWSTEATEAYQDMVAMAESAHPDLKINLEFTGGTMDYWAKLPVAIAGGTGPDIFQMTRPSFDLYAGSNQAADLTDAIAASEKLQANLAEMSDVVVESYSHNGKQMGIPYTVEAAAIAYNKDMFAAAGLTEPKEVEDTWTWTDVREMANTLTIRDDKGDASQYGFVVAADRLPLWELIWSHGGELFTEDQKECLVGSDIVVEALTPYIEMYRDDKVSPSIDAIATMSADDMFMSGRIGMLVAGIWKMPTYRGITGFEWDIAQLPFDPATGKRVSSSNVLGFLVNPNTAQMDNCVRILEEFTSPEGQQILADKQLYIPANESVRENYFKAEQPANILAYQKTLDYIHPNIVTQYVVYDDFNRLFHDGVRNAMNGADIATSLKEAEDNINAVAQENIKNFE